MPPNRSRGSVRQEPSHPDHHSGAWLRRPHCRLRNLGHAWRILSVYERLDGGIYIQMGTEGMVTHPLGSVVLPPPYTHPLHAHFWGDKRRKSISVDVSPKLRLKINRQPAVHFLCCRLSKETMQLKHLHVDTSAWSQLKGQIKTSRRRWRTSEDELKASVSELPPPSLCLLTWC